MEYAILRGTDIKVSRLAVGGCPMGQYGWGAVQKAELIAAVHEALDIGINFFDTADIYGLGASETTLAEALGEKRRHAVIATKFGMRNIGGKTVLDCSAEWLRTALERSLSRLRTDYIDLYQIHYYDGKTPFGEILTELEKLKAEGKIRSYGLCNLSEAEIGQLKRLNGTFSSCQEEYSLACRKNEGVLRSASERLNVTPMSWGSLGQGILTGKYDEAVSFGPEDRRSRTEYVNFHGKKLSANMKIVDRLRICAKKYNKPVAAIALRWNLDTLENGIVLAGVKRPEQLREQCQALNWRLDAEDMRILNDVSLSARIETGENG